ncbi:hypothetical protein [Leucobacter sp. NPDC077196]|uniref:hypothetical protein n=1 Tax=Leucobacter sp. NPDC077196 TaxID=3154959 RepID=UPI0034168FAD
MLRYIVERIADGEFLELELPIDVSGAGRKMNGAGSFSGVVSPDVGGLRYGDGTLLIDPYATFIHEESDGVIRGTWLVTRSELDESVWKIEGAGFSAYFSGRPYEGVYRGVGVDPIAVARHVVEHAQSFANANIGVTLTGASSVRVGSDSEVQESAARTALSVAKANLSDVKKVLAAARAAAKVNPTAANKAAVVARKEEADLASAAKKAREEALAAAKAVVQEDGGAWKLLWWDTPDCLESIQDAIDAAGYEWVEWSGWNADRSKVLKEIRAVRRVGRKQNALSFVEGDNVIEAVTVRDDSSQYANKIVAIGAGEGRDSLRFVLPGKDSRRSKPVVVDAKHVTKRAVLEQIARAELKKRMQRFRVDAIRVADHPNAQFGTFGVGDTITVHADVEWVGRQQFVARIEELEFVGEDIVDVMLGDG